MDCREFRSKIPDFVNGTIEPSCLDEFLNHAKNCSDCMDEMEINYMINTGLEKIEDNDRDSYTCQEGIIRPFGDGGSNYGNYRNS